MAFKYKALAADPTFQMMVERNASLQEILAQFPDSKSTATIHKAKMAYRAGGLSLAAQVQADLETKREQAASKDLSARYKYVLDENAALKKQLDDATALARNIETVKIEPFRGDGTSEAVPVLVASDWHLEEEVTRGQTSGLNQFNLEIAEQRVQKFFKRGLRLIDIFAQDVTIKTAVLALLGDFITNNIHEDAAESNQLSPIQAAMTAQNWLASGIEFLLNHSKLDLVIPCHSGNHARTTHKQRIATEHGNSLETFLYTALANHFRNEPRVKFIISEGYHSYIDLYGYTLRFHHGHAVKYGGGVGGISIPVNKAVAQWQKLRRADLDVFGHFHQCIDGGRWICNGSLIGYNAFALAIKADYEPPKQACFLIDKARFKTFVAPILFD